MGGLADAALQIWTPVIGRHNAESRARAQTAMMTAAVALIVGLVGTIVLFALIQTIVGIALVVAMDCVVVGIWIWATSKLTRLGRDIATSLRGAGHTIDRNAPMQNVFVFRKWMDRNRLTVNDVVSAGDGRALG